MDYYIPHQRDELPTNKWEDKYQVGEELPKFNYIHVIHEIGNEDSYHRYIKAEVQLTDGSGKPRLGKVIKRRKGTNGDIIGSFHMNPFIKTQE